MITVDKSVEIKKLSLKSAVGVPVVKIIGIGLMLLGMIVVQTSEITGAALVLGGIVSMTVGVVIIKCIYRKAHLKYLNRFFEELRACGFNRDVVFDSGPLRAGDPAVIVVDYRKHKVGVMFYNNPKSPYLIPSGLIKQVRSGKDSLMYDVSAELGFCVNGTEVTVPTKVRYALGRRYYYYKIDYRTRKKYLKGNGGKAFNEAVEKADEFAKVLKKLTVFN